MANVLAFMVTWRKKFPQSNGKISAVQVKQIVKSLGTLGKDVTSVKLNPDGSFQLTTVTKSGENSSEQSYWDKVLQQ